MLDRLMPYTTAIKVVVAALMLCGVFFSGMRVESWKKDKEIAQIELSQKVDEIARMRQATTDLYKATSDMRIAAESAMNVKKVNDEKLNSIAEGIKKFKPLPVDCKPDSLRRINLETAIDIANNSIP